MIRTLRAALAAFAIAFCCAPALAQSSFPTPSGSYVDGHALMCPNGSTDFQGRPVMVPCSSSVPLAVSGSFTANLGGFQPTTQGTPIIATTSGVPGTLPAGTSGVAQDVIPSGGTAFPAWCQFGGSSAGITGGHYLSGAGAQWAYLVPAGATQLTCEGVGGTTQINLYGGSGLGVDTGGGGGGGSPGGGVVTQPNGSLLNATVVPAPDVATNTPITVQDAGTTCASTPAPVQTQCTGTATAGSVASVAITGQQGAAVVASLTSGTVATVSFISEFSWDGGATWYGRGLFLDSNVAPIWKNGIANNVFSGSISVPPGATNYRIRAATLTGTSPNINIKIILSQSNSGAYVYNLPTAAAGISSVAAVNIQGEASGVPVITNQTQLAGTNLAAPTATGVAPAGGAVVPNVNAAITGGSVTATFGQWAPNGNNAQLTVGATSSPVALPAGVVVTIDNTGANTAFFRLGVGSATATAADTAVPSGGFKCVTVGSNTFLGAIETAGATALNINGGAGGCAGAGGGGGSSASVAADTNLTPSPTTISAVNNFSTGLQVQNWTNGRTTLTGTPTAGSAVGFTGLAGWNSGIVECQTGGAQGTNQYEIDVSGPSGGTVMRRVATFTGPTASIPINLAGQVFVNVVADQWSAGALACTMRVSVNQSVPDDWAVPVQADLDASGNFSAATTQLIAAIPGETIVVNSWDEFTPGSSTSDAKWHFAYGTGTNCGTGTTSKSSNRDFSGSAGLTRSGGGGIGFTVPPGNALCVVIDTAPSTGTVGVDVSYANR